uniref:holo-[acyl-carrier-protein] synthase n=1 Tax=Mycena chlorophos TaxID=658473 RepID=A0ABQ0LS09_MYCCL|nr:ebony activating protein [Mycena chlorophos]
MQVRAIIYEPDEFPDELYQRALLLLDPESSARIKKFYRREDACRTLIGRFLPRMLLHDRGVALSAMEFAATEVGKPFITTQGLDPPIAYNVSHDNGLVVVASSNNTHNPPAFTLGIDVMKVRVPGRESLASFVDSMADQLTTLERRLIASAADQDQALERFFWMWTAKEAYTKALGFGLGFDFQRVEFDPTEDTLRVDGRKPAGWIFSKFVVLRGGDRYQGVVAEFVGGDETTVVAESQLHNWVALEHAAPFIRAAIQKIWG